MIVIQVPQTSFPASTKYSLEKLTREGQERLDSNWEFAHLCAWVQSLPLLWRCFVRVTDTR